MKVQIFSDPWEYGVIDDFLCPERFDIIKNLANEELERFKKEGCNTPRGKYVRYVKEDLVPEVTQEIMNIMNHRDYNKLVKLNHWAIMPPNLEYPTHIDNISRIHTSTFYISPEKQEGTLLCDNPSTNDNGDHNNPNKPSRREVQVEWKPNRVFIHNPRPMQWHRYISGDSDRVNLSIFFADPDKIKPHRQDFDYFIDCD